MRLLEFLRRYLPALPAVLVVLSALDKFAAGEEVESFVTWKNIRLRVVVDRQPPSLRIERA